MSGREKRPTQRDHVLDALKWVGAKGLHTFELRAGRFGRIIANPSERFAELERDGHILIRRRERLNGNAIGVRVWLEEHAPAELMSVSRKVAA